MLDVVCENLLRHRQQNIDSMRAVKGGSYSSPSSSSSTSISGAGGGGGSRGQASSTSVSGLNNPFRATTGPYSTYSGES